jgi:hypothetical protein
MYALSVAITGPTAFAALAREIGDKRFVVPLAGAGGNAAAANAMPASSRRLRLVRMGVTLCINFSSSQLLGITFLTPLNLITGAANLTALQQRPHLTYVLNFLQIHNSLDQLRGCVSSQYR